MEKSKSYNLKAIPSDVNELILDEQARKRLERKVLKDKESVIYSIVREWAKLKKYVNN